MREIKFRAWDVERHEWIAKGFNILGEIMMSGLLFDRPILSLNDIIIEQYTGLHDKNGREIYEGDKVRDSTGVSVVVWNPLFASFCLRRDGWAFDHFFGEAVDPFDVEIVGNIHE